MQDVNQKEDSLIQDVDAAVGAVYRAVFRDGTLDAAFRQGADELWQALKAFPETIEVHESGTILNPLHSTIAKDSQMLSASADLHQAETGHAPSPSEIVRESRHSMPEQDAVLIVEPEIGRMPTPSEIVREARENSPEQDQSHSHEHSHGRD
jgi:hypothetical protein